MAATRMLAREWRGGELGVLAMALVLAVGLVTGISVFTSRLQSALEQESHRFLAADMVLRSGTPAPQAWLDEARAEGLATARTLSFPSMLFGAGDAMHLASVKAVSAGYPLRGELRFSSVPFGESVVASSGPAPGEVWLDSRLFPLLGVAVGDRVELGDTSLRVSGSVRGEPDQGAGNFGYGPRALMHIDDIAATGVVQPGSRVEFRQLYAGPPELLEQFKASLLPRLEPGQRLLDLEDGQPRVSSALERAERFLLLAGSLGVVLAGVAIALAAGRFSERHTDYVAVMKSLGATAADISWLYGRSLMMLALLATAVGCGLGWGMQALFFRLFAAQLPILPGDSGLQPYLVGGATALVCILSFAWPPIRRLTLASPLRVLRRDMPHALRHSTTDYLVGLLAVCGLMLWYCRDWQLTLAVVSGLGMVVLLGFAGALMLLRGGRMLGMHAGSLWRLGLANLQRRGAANALQVVVFGMAIMLVLVLVLVRTSLLEEWRMQLPADAPNHFAINIAADEQAAFGAMLDQRQIPSQPLFPMVRGRVMSINGVALPSADEVAEGEAHQRESNLTWSATLPEGNELVAGQWWEEGSAEAQVSVERDYAERMGLEVGDRLGLRIGEQSLDVTVASLRALDWESMRPNFFLVFPPGLLERFPATFMTSFHLAARDKLFLNQLLHRFPTVTVIEMDEVINEVRGIVDQVSAAVELVLLVILATGALVLVAGVQASMDTRMQEGAVLRALGAGRGLLLGALAIEFIALGLCAGLLAVGAAEIAVALLQVIALDMRYTPSPWLWPLGLAAGGLLIGVLGVYSARRVVTTPPVAVLREL
ncbi:ABC transporter permease [Haliea sp. E17]|uniref:ABC transporter permease n=1 Tax=Haliea sp. E17 TaxID=3401576 RepID=UPI003AADAA24